MDVGKSVFRAIADFSAIRREARSTSRELAGMNRTSSETVKTVKGVAAALLTGAKGFGKFVGKMALALPLLGALSAGLLGLTASVLGLIGGLAPLAGLGVILPGLLAGLAVGGIAFALAMKDAKTQLAELAPLMSQVQKSASSGFWSNAAAPIKDMARTLLPEVIAGMGAVGSAVGLMAAKFSNGLKTFMGGGVLAKMFEYTAQGAAEASKAMEPLASILATLGYVGSQYLPRMGVWFTDLTNRFNDFLQLADDQGKLQQWADGGITALREVGAVIGAAWRVMSLLVQAASNAAPGSTLSVMAGALERFAAVLARPEVQSGLTNVFAGAQQAMGSIMVGVNALGTALGVLGPALQTVMKSGGEILGKVLSFVAEILSTPGVGEGIIAFMDGLSRGLDALAPALGPIGDLLAAVLPLAGSVAEAFGTFLGPALAFLAPILTDIAKTLTPIAPVLVALAGAIALVLFALNLTWIGLIVIAIIAVVAAISWLVQNWDAVVAFISQVWGGFLNWCKEVTDGFVTWWNTVWGGFGNWLGEIWGGMVNWITEIWNGFVTWITGGVAAFVGWWLSVWTPFASGVTSIWQGIVDFFAYVWGMISLGAQIFAAGFIAVWNSIMAFLAPLFAVFGAMFNAFGAMFTFIGALIGFVVGVIIIAFQLWWSYVVTAMTAIWDVIVSVWNAVVGFIAGVLTAIGGWISSVWNSIVAWVSAALAAIWAVVTTVWNAVSGFISSVLQAIWGYVSSVWNMVVSYIGAVLNMIWGIIVSVWNSVSGFISGVLGAIWGTISSGWNSILSVVSSAMGNIWSAIVNKWNEIVSWVGGIGGRIVAALGDLGSLLWNAGTSIIQGLIDGLKSMWDGVAGFFKDLTASIPDWKGPEKTDKKLLTKAGQLVLGGFLKGAESMYGKVRKSLGGFTKDLSTDTRMSIRPELVGGGFDTGNLLGSSPYSQNADVFASTETTAHLNTTPTAITYDVRELNVNNPKPERASESLPRAVRRLGYVGVGGNA